MSIFVRIIRTAFTVRRNIASSTPVVEVAPRRPARELPVESEIKMKWRQARASAQDPEVLNESENPRTAVRSQ